MSRFKVHDIVVVDNGTPKQAEGEVVFVSPLTGQFLDVKLTTGETIPVMASRLSIKEYEPTTNKL